MNRPRGGSRRRRAVPALARERVASALGRRRQEAHAALRRGGRRPDTQPRQDLGEESSGVMGVAVGDGGAKPAPSVGSIRSSMGSSWAGSGQAAVSAEGGGVIAPWHLASTKVPDLPGGARSGILAGLSPAAREYSDRAAPRGSSSAGGRSRCGP